MLNYENNHYDKANTRAGRWWNFKTNTLFWIENRYIRYICSAKFFLLGDVKLGQFEYLLWEYHQNKIIFRPIVPFQTDIEVGIKNPIFEFCKIPYGYFQIFSNRYEIFGLLTSPSYHHYVLYSVFYRSLHFLHGDQPIIMLV